MRVDFANDNWDFFWKFFATLVYFYFLQHKRRGGGLKPPSPSPCVVPYLGERNVSYPGIICDQAFFFSEERESRKNWTVAWSQVTPGVI